MIPRNPFRPTKIEHDNEPLFLLSQTARSIPSTFKKVYVPGARGSGKTTLLRSLSTQEITKNPQLHRQYDRARFDWFGVYIKFAKSLQSLVSASTKGLGAYLQREALEINQTPLDLDFRVFQTYFEISLLITFLRDLKMVRGSKKIVLLSKTERANCKAILKRLGDEERWPDVDGLLDALLEVRSSFTALPSEQSLFRISQLVGAFVPGELVGFARDLTNDLQGELVRKGVPIRLMILIDDAETLTRDQQIFLNTIAKTLEGEVKFVIAYITGDYERNGTLLENTVLKHDDFDLVDLDDPERYDFMGFCERVTDLRLRHFFDASSGDHKKTLSSFSLQRTLGDFTPNELIAEATKGSLSPQVTKWKSAVESTRTTLRGIIPQKYWNKFSISDGMTPFVEHELIGLLQIPWDDFKSLDSLDVKARLLARKQVAALVYIFDRVILNREIIYAGKSTVGILATSNIRDYLDIMAHIFDSFMEARDNSWSSAKGARPSDLRGFVEPKAPIPPDIQGKGIREASESKWRILNDFTISIGFNVPTAVTSLALLTQRLQRPKVAKDFVSTAERGLFTFDPERLDKILQVRGSSLTSHAFLKTLHRDGFIRHYTVHGETPTMAKSNSLEHFHVHRRLFPRLGISHRGPYATFRIDENQLASLLLIEEISREKWVLRVTKSEKAAEAKQSDFDL